MREREYLSYYSPVQYLKDVALLQSGKKNYEVCEELFISHTAVMKIKKLIKGSLSIEQTRQLKPLRDKPENEVPH